MAHWLTRLARRFNALFHRSALDTELDDEIAQHIELETEDLMRMRGLSREDAHRQAMLAFGGVQRAREAQRDVRGVRWLQDAMSDLIYAVRSLRKSPGFALTVIVTIALGIGVSTAVFSVVNRLILNPLPFKDADQWRVFASTWKLEGQTRAGVVTSDAFDWASRATTVEDVSIIHRNGGLLVSPQRSLSMYGYDVNPDLLTALGVRPKLGRLFTRADAESNTDRVMVISDQFWHTTFGGDPSVVGTRVTLRDTSYTILGVVPDRLDAITQYESADYWAPLTPAQIAFFQREQYGVNGVAKLKPGITAARAEQELNTLRKQKILAAGQSTEGLVPIQLVRPTDLLGANFALGLRVVTVATLLVLLIACANVAALHMVRAERRGVELSVRSALGASRARLLRQLGVEGAVLAIAGGVGGMLVGAAMLRAIQAARPVGLRELTIVEFNGSVLWFGIGLVALTCVLYTVFPAWIATGRRSAGLIHAGRAAGSGRMTTRTRSVVVVAELAMSILLLVGTGLLVRSLQRMNEMDPGFDADHTAEMTTVLPSAAFPDSTSRAAFWSTLVQRVEAVPGVTAAVPADFGQLQSGVGYATYNIELEGAPSSRAKQQILFSSRRVPGRYFSTLGIRVIAGHVFSDEDERGQTQNVIVGERLAKQLWPGQSAVGKRFRTWTKNPWVTVIGVVADVGLVGISHEARDLQMYGPSAPTSMSNAMGIIVRMRPGADVKAVARTLPSLASSVNTHIVVSSASTERSILDANLAIPRFISALMTTFAIAALFLAAVGLYGLMAYTVGQRTREIGVRVALGARTTTIVRGVAASAAWMVLTGAVLGLATALAGARLIGSMLYDTAPADPAVLASVVIVLAVAAVVASYFPARRAARVDPVIALRAE